MVLPPNSPYRCLWDSFRQGEYSLCYTTEILNEYEELLLRFFSPVFTNLTVGILLKSPNVIQVVPYYKWKLISTDPDDNKFVDCALNAGADYIVTNDKHFNVLKDIDFPKINIVDIDAFKEMLNI
jgi:predicted nucleic acid-binding protein